MLLETDIAAGTAELEAIVASADGLQTSADRATTTHHFSNTLYNVMRAASLSTTTPSTGPTSSTSSGSGTAVYWTSRPCSLQHCRSASTMRRCSPRPQLPARPTYSGSATPTFR